jgi:hypothetical protein
LKWTGPRFHVSCLGSLCSYPVGAFMPIRPFLAGRAFEPETVAVMSAALERACREMRLRDIDDIVTKEVAQKIIELVDRGVIGADALSSQAVKELTGPG